MYPNQYFSAEIPSQQLILIKVLIVLNIVLITIILLFLFFRFIVPWLRKSRHGRRKEITDIQILSRSQYVPSGDIAAIAMALYLYFNEMHDQESDIITVKRVSKTYSPWSSKLYSMRNLR
jgi:hypothetical protein